MKVKGFLLLLVVVSSYIFGVCQAITEADVIEKYKQKMLEKSLYDTNPFCNDPDCGK
jgi:hypothetical protein